VKKIGYKFEQMEKMFLNIFDVLKKNWGKVRPASRDVERVVPIQHPEQPHFDAVGASACGAGGACRTRTKLSTFGWRWLLELNLKVLGCNK